MPAVGGSAGSYGRLIVTPDMEPPDADALGHPGADLPGWRYVMGRNPPADRPLTTQRFAMPPIRRASTKHTGRARCWPRKPRRSPNGTPRCADKCADIATVLRDTRAGQEQLVREADAKIASAKLPGEAEALVTQYHGIARYQTEAGVTAAMASHTAFKASTENTRALDLLTKWGDVPAAPPAQPVDHTSPGIEQDENPYRYTEKRKAGADAPKPVDDAPTDPAGTSTTQPGVGPGIKTATGDEGIKAATGPVTQPTPGVASSPAASALGGGGMPSMGGMGGGGMGSGGVRRCPAAWEVAACRGWGPIRWVAVWAKCPVQEAVCRMQEECRLGHRGRVASVGVHPGNVDDGGASAGECPSAPPPAPASPSPALSAGGPAHAGVGGSGRWRLAGRGAARHGVPAAPAAAPTGAGMGTGGGAPMMLPPGFDGSAQRVRPAPRRRCRPERSALPVMLHRLRRRPLVRVRARR